MNLVIGASGVYEPGWIPTNIEFLDLLSPEDWQYCLSENSVDSMLAEHVWEHLSLEDGVKAARQCFDYLRPGGYLRVAVPDGFHPSPEYIEWVRPHGSGAGADDHKVLYDHTSFAEIFEKAGFRIKLLEYFDSAGEFHFNDWSPSGGKVRRSKRFDERNNDTPLSYTSLILDAIKDA